MLCSLANRALREVYWQPWSDLIVSPDAVEGVGEQVVHSIGDGVDLAVVKLHSIRKTLN